MTAMTKKKTVSRANKGRCLKNNNGIAKALEMFSNTQFSIFRLASSHMPAHAVELTHASQYGTVEVVNLASSSASTAKLMDVIMITVSHSSGSHADIFTCGWSFFFAQSPQP